MIKLDWVKNFNFDIFYASFLNFIVKFSNIVYTLVRTLIVTIGIPLGLWFILQVEVPRVQSGIAIYDKVELHAYSAAVVVVMILLIMDFLILYLENKDNYHQPVTYSFTIAKLLRWLWYVSGLYLIGNWLGLEFNTENYRQSPANRYIQLRNIVMWGIVFIAFVGTMYPEFQIYQETNPNEAWHISLLKVITDSKLTVFGVWISSVSLTVILVLSGTALSHYIAVVAYETISAVNTRVTSLKNSKRFMSLKDLVDKSSIRALNALDLTKFTVDDKIEMLGDKQIRFIGSDGSMSKTFDLTKPNNRKQLSDFLFAIAEQRTE